MRGMEGLAEKESTSVNDNKKLTNNPGLMAERIVNEMRYGINPLVGTPALDALKQPKTGMQRNYMIIRDRSSEQGKKKLREYYRREFARVSHFIPKEQYNELVERYANNHPAERNKYRNGCAVGLGEGLWVGAKNTVTGIFDLVKLIAKLGFESLKFTGKTITKIPGTLWEGLKFIVADFVKHITDRDQALKEDIAILKDAGAIAKSIGGFIYSTPGMVWELLKEGKNLLHKEIGKSLMKWADKDAYNQGKDAGRLAGQTIFEVVTIAVGTKGVGKAAKLAKRGKLALILQKAKLDKVARAVEKLADFKNKYSLLLQGTKYDDLLRLFAQRKLEVSKERSGKFCGRLPKKA